MKVILNSFTLWGSATKKLRKYCSSRHLTLFIQYTNSWHYLLTDTWQTLVANAHSFSWNPCYMSTKMTIDVNLVSFNNNFNPRCLWDLARLCVWLDLIPPSKIGIVRVLYIFGLSAYSQSGLGQINIQEQTPKNVFERDGNICTKFTIFYRYKSQYSWKDLLG